MTRTVGRWKVTTIETRAAPKSYGIKLVHRDTDEQAWFEIYGASHERVHVIAAALTVEEIEARVRQCRSRALPS